MAVNTLESNLKNWGYKKHGPIYRKQLIVANQAEKVLIEVEFLGTLAAIRITIPGQDPIPMVVPALRVDMDLKRFIEIAYEVNSLVDYHILVKSFITY